MNCAPANVSLRVLRETFLFPFREAIEKGGAISVMASYNEVDGVPSHANKWLLRDVLRKEWGFKGFVVSDYYAIWELSYRPDTTAISWPRTRRNRARWRSRPASTSNCPIRIAICTSWNWCARAC